MSQNKRQLPAKKHQVPSKTRQSQAKDIEKPDDIMIRDWDQWQKMDFSQNDFVLAWTVCSDDISIFETLKDFHGPSDTPLTAVVTYSEVNEDFTINLYIPLFGISFDDSRCLLGGLYELHLEFPDSIRYPYVFDPTSGIGVDVDLEELFTTADECSQ